MKKLLVVLLTLVLCVATLTSCDLANQFLENFQLLRGDSINVNEAADYIYNMYKDMEVTATDYELTAKTNIGGVSYDVTWSVNTNKVKITKKDENTYLVDLNERSPEDVPYVLTATIRALDRTTAKKQFNLMVPLYDAIPHADYMAAEKSDKDVTIAGIVVAINSKEGHNNKYNHLFLADADVTGGYYCYKTKTDPAKLGIEVGMTVKVTGKISPYSGMQEMTDGQVAILDKTIKEVPVLDITEKFANGEDLKAYVGLPVTIKGVEIGTQDMSLETSQYLYFKLNGKTSYIRTYVSDFPAPLKINKEGEVYTSPDKDTIDTAHANHFGWEANATGILVMFNSNPYLIPMGVDCFEYIEKIVKTPEQQIAEALENLSIPNFISEDTILELPKVSSLIPEVAFSWAVDKEGYTITDNKIDLKVSSTPVELVFTVTATCEGKTDTKTFTVKVALPEMSIEEALKLADNSTVVVVGVVTNIADKDVWSEKYGNMSVTITDNTGSLYLFRIPTKVELGDVIKVTGKMATYKESRQIAQGATVEVLKVSTSAEATAAKDGTAVILAGKVTNIAEKDAWSTKYNNMSVTITDAAGTYYLFRISTKVELGDEIVVIGKVGSYNGAKQIAQGSTTIITKKATTDEGGEGEGEGEGENTTVSVTITDISAANSWKRGEVAESFKMNNDITVSVTGTPTGNYGLNSGKPYGPSDSTVLDNWRIYQNESPELKIVAAEGKTIVSVKITYSVSNAGILTQGTTQIDSTTVVEVNANSVTFSVGNTGGKTNGQVRITAIEVVYA